MKKIFMIVLIVMMSIALIGCDKAMEQVGEIFGEEVNQEELYSNINSVIISPGSDSPYERLPRKFKFVSLILSEPFEMEIEDENGEYNPRNFVYGGISRNQKDVFFIDITEIDNYAYQVFDIVEIETDYVHGIYWTEEGSREHIASFIANDINLYEEEVGETFTGETIVVENIGDYTFKSANVGKDIFGDAIILYLEFLNKTDEDIAPSLAEFRFYQGDTMLEYSSFGLSSDTKSDPNALHLSMMAEKTYPGKTQLYYAVLTPSRAEGEVYDSSAPIEIEMYGDTYNLKYYFPIEISE
ncbi:MAG: hypothetical protein GXZ08_03600 [Tissierellia bacterium]|nr:hypothetical protein [Tissierellia bacterium]